MEKRTDVNYDDVKVLWPTGHITYRLMGLPVGIVIIHLHCYLLHISILCVQRTCPNLLPES